MTCIVAKRPRVIAADNEARTEMIRIARSLGVDLIEVTERGPRGHLLHTYCEPRRLLWREMHKAGYGLARIGRLFGSHHSSVRSAVKCEGAGRA